MKPWKVAGWRLWAGLVASLLLGAGAATLPVLALETDPQHVVPRPGDRVRAAIEELRVDRVHVPPDGRSMLDETGEARLEKIVADSEPAVYVVVWAATREAGHSSPGEVVDEIGAAIDPRAVVVVWEGPGRGNVGALDGYVSSSMRFEGDPAARVAELVDELQGQVIEPIDGQETTSDLVGGALVGALGALCAYGLLMTVVGAVRLRRGRPFLVPGPQDGDP